MPPPEGDPTMSDKDHLSHAALERGDNSAFVKE
jgi:hypothetical protein